MRNAPLKRSSNYRGTEGIDVSSQQDASWKKFRPPHFQYRQTSGKCNRSFSTTHRSIQRSLHALQAVNPRDHQKRRKKKNFHCSVLAAVPISMAHTVFQLFFLFRMFHSQTMFLLIPILAATRRTIKAGNYRMKMMEMTAIQKSELSKHSLSRYCV